VRKLRISTVGAAAGVLFILIVFFAPAGLHHIRALGWLYAPAILASLVTSGGHYPAAVQTWASTIVQSGVQLSLGILVFALVQEWTHFRAAAPHFDEAARHLALAHPDDAMAAFGRGMAEVNRRRQRAFFLTPIPVVTPAAAQEDANAFEAFVGESVRNHEQQRAVKKAFRNVERKLTLTVSKPEAVRRVEEFRQLAKRGRSAQGAT
jgi:hypothetical protein